MWSKEQVSREMQVITNEELIKVERIMSPIIASYQGKVVQYPNRKREGKKSSFSTHTLVTKSYGVNLAGSKRKYSIR